MPRTKEENHRIRTERIKNIRNAAMRVYAVKGYLGTQMDDIAKEAGLAKGLLYYYFKSKTDLFQDLFRELMDQAREHSKDTMNRDRSLKESLEAYISFLVSAGFEQPVYPLVYKMIPEDLSQVFSDNPAEIQQSFFNQFTRPQIELFSLAMERGEIPKGNPKIAALLFTSGVLTISHSIASNPAIAEASTKEEVIEAAKRQLFYGIFGGGNGIE